MSASGGANPKIVFVFSGKRKSGKDYLTDEFIKLLPEGSAVILRLSGPLKQAYAVEHGLDYDRLLDASDYKEQFRADMVRWGEQKRSEDPGFFCKLAIEHYKAKNFPVWIVSDARRQSDVEFFEKFYPEQTLLCRVIASDETRESRGWSFVPGIDDAETECGLDNFEYWDFQLVNEGEEASKLLEDCVECAVEALRRFDDSMDETTGSSDSDAASSSPNTESTQ